MPGYNSEERKKDKLHRSKKLVESAQDSVSTFWSGRSWTEIGWGLGKTVLSWASGTGLKVAINVASGSLFGALGEQLVKRASSSGYGPERLAHRISQSAVELFWPLVDDVVKGSTESLAISAAGAISSRMGSSTVALPAANAASNAFKNHNIQEAMEKMQTSTSELFLRASALNESLKNANSSKVRYCDNVHYMALEAYQIDALRAEVIQYAANLAAYATGMQNLAANVDVKALLKEIRKVSDAVVDDKTTVAHYNSYSFNVLGRASQCSEAHCWGPDSSKLGK